MAGLKREARRVSIRECPASQTSLRSLRKLDCPAGHDVKYRSPTAKSIYFFAGAIFESAGAMASGFAAVLAAWSKRSTLAPSRSLAT